MMDRRRVLMASSGVVLPPVPSGYITNGLVFFLDGKQLATASKWIDIVGGKVFNLTDCTKNGNGIAFNGSTSYGSHAGEITHNATGETIEIVFYGPDSDTGYDIKTRAIFAQPYLTDGVGISCRFGNAGGNTCRVATALDGVNRIVKHFTYTVGASQVRTIGATIDSLVYRGTSYTNSSSTAYSKNQSGNTYLGAFATTGGPIGRIMGTIYAVRIYNRKLSVAEMQANQANDLTYYNLTL